MPVPGCHPGPTATTTHALSGGCLSQRDLPVSPGHLTAVRVRTANVPRITGPDWLIVHDVTAFRIELPADLAPGAVVEWADTPGDGSDLDDLSFTVVEAVDGTSVTFAHFGRGADGAIAAACHSNRDGR